MKKEVCFIMAVGLLTLCSACRGTEKFQNVVNVHNQIVPFNPEGILCSSSARLSVMGDYLIIQDSRDQGKLYHLLDKRNLQYLCSTGDKGQGPGELSDAWCPMYDEARHKFYVPDPNFKKIFSFDIDSVMKDPDYLPTVKQEMAEGENRRDPISAIFVNDTLTYGKVADFYTGSKYRMISMKWNLQTGQMWLNEHHQGRRTYSNMAYSPSHNLVVESDGAYDLLTLMDGDMNLMRYIKGPQWSEERDKLYHFGDVAFYEDYIIAEYDGTLWADANLPRICHVFDIDGNYIKTLDFDYNINSISVDEENARLYITFNDEIQFGYLELSDLLP